MKKPYPAEMFFTWILPCPIILTILFGTMHISSGVKNPKNFHPEFSGFDCNGEVAEGTVTHQVVSRQFPDGKLICCYPKSCDGGTIDFCTKHKGTDMCVPCPVDGKCNYREVSSKNLFKRFDHCTDECIRKNAVPDVLFNPTSFTKKAGDDITLQPTIYSDPPQTGFIWRFINETISSIIADSLRGVITKPEKYGVGTMPNPYLNVTNIDLSNQGTYQLCVGNEVGLSNAINVTLNVTAKPIVSMVTERDHVDVGYPFTLACSISGNPTPVEATLRFKDMQGEETDISSVVFKDGTLIHTIHNTSSSDTGYYTCKAENSEGIGESSLHLTVYIPPGIYSSYDGKKLRRYDAGDKMSITLWVTTTPHVDAFSCRNVNNSKELSPSLPFNITNIGMSFNFSIANIQQKDEGLYICTATNKIGVSHISIEIAVNSDIKPPVPYEAEKTDCLWLSLPVLVFTVIAVAGAIFGLIRVLIVKFGQAPRGNAVRNRNNENDRKGSTRSWIAHLVIFAIIIIFCIAVCVVVNFGECSTSDQDTFSIFCVVIVASLTFETWFLCHEINRKPSRNNEP